MTKPLIERQLKKFYPNNYPEMENILIKCRLECEKRIDDIELKEVKWITKEEAKQIIKEVWG